MDLTQHRLPHLQHQSPPLLQHHVRRARNQIIPVPGVDGRERLHAARDHDHASGVEGTAKDGRGLIVREVGVVGEGADVERGVFGFVAERGVEVDDMVVMGRKEGEWELVWVYLKMVVRGSS
ncbi:hypothetical protein ACMFMF_002494 [Clarireedia jacksonii]